MCDTTIHNELININEPTCPFCDKLLIKGDTTADQCCDNQQIDDINGIQVCIDCGLVHSCLSKSDYIDFFENVYRIRRKSIYIRKYHIENIMNDLLLNQGVELTYDQRARIYKVFEHIGHILPQINGNRKRIISIRYILYNILEMMNLSYNIDITKSKRTLAFYNRYWNQVMALIGDKIRSIIDK